MARGLMMETFKQKSAAMVVFVSLSPPVLDLGRVPQSQVCRECEQQSTSWLKTCQSRSLDSLNVGF
jgi:hypothetical protein